MTLTIRLISFLVLVILATVTLLSISPVASANEVFNICDRYSANDPNAPTVCREAADSATQGQTATSNRVISLLADVVGVLMWALGVASVLAIFVAGVVFATSAGDPQKAQKARNIIIYAAIGLAVALVSQLIIYFVIDRFF